MLTDRDWVRLGELADTIKDGKVGASLDDLDAPLRVGLCELGWESRFSGERIGELRGFAVIVWER